MRPKSFMLIAGEASGDTLAAELVMALNPALTGVEAKATTDLQPLRASLKPRFFGAGGPKMAAAGVELAFDLTAHAVVGISEVLRNYGKFRRFFKQLLVLASQRQPDVIVLVDYPGFNLRFAKAIKRHVQSRLGSFANWNPKIVCYVSPQLWAWHESRVHQIARDVDLMLSIFPFEKEWYAKRAPELRVQYVGHPLVDRYPNAGRGAEATAIKLSQPMQDRVFSLSPLSGERAEERSLTIPTPLLLLLPGSRARELNEHLPVMVEAAERIAGSRPIRAQIVLPNRDLAQHAQRYVPARLNLVVTSSGLEKALREAEVAIASSGTVTMECAFFGVPTVVIYKASWSNYWLAKQFLKVKFLAMPNLLANEEVYPEHIQQEATAERIAEEALNLLNDGSRRSAIKTKLRTVVQSLGPPGASFRAAQAIVNLLVEQGTVKLLPTG